MTRAPAGPQHRELEARVRAALFGGIADPVKIGRFTVLRRLGAGGMGVVYSAFDGALDRKVAIKLMRPELLGHDGEQRLRREARIAAQIAHPNVVAVYETGMHDGRVYVAMEFVHGRTLGEWLRAESWPWTRKVDVFLQAGLGLRAAHAAGLVHRDFKPDNVMVGDDGRVRVLDFGVARIAASPALPGEREGSTPAVASSPSTLAGTLVGTPAYMAPEQHAGGIADARTDQYSFCLTLWEALFGESPYAATDPDARTRAKASGELRAPTSSTRVPLRLRRLLQRGLSPRPDDRHPSMDRLLVELASVRRGRHRVVLATLVAVAALVAIGVVARTIGHRSACVPGRDKLREIWSSEVREGIRESLRARAQAGVGDAWLELEPRLDDYAERWHDAYERACTGPTPSEELGLGRLLCLTAQLRQLGDLSQQLARGELELEAAGTALTHWDRPETCLDPAGLRAWSERAALQNAAAPAGSASGLVSDFEGEALVRFGEGWHASTDAIFGGDSRAELAVVADEADHVLRIRGEVVPSELGWSWAGAIFMPGTTPMTPANLSDKRRIRFAVRGDPGNYGVMLFAQSRGWEPSVVAIEVTPAWTGIDVPLTQFDVPLFEITAIFIGRIDAGKFVLDVDDVRLDAM